MQVWSSRVQAVMFVFWYTWELQVFITLPFSVCQTHVYWPFFFFPALLLWNMKIQVKTQFCILRKLNFPFKKKHEKLSDWERNAS